MMGQQHPLVSIAFSKIRIINLLINSWLNFWIYVSKLKFCIIVLMFKLLINFQTPVVRRSSKKIYQTPRMLQKNLLGKERAKCIFSLKFVSSGFPPKATSKSIKGPTLGKNLTRAQFATKYLPPSPTWTTMRLFTARREISNVKRVTKVLKANAHWNFTRCTTVNRNFLVLAATRSITHLRSSTFMKKQAIVQNKFTNILKYFNLILQQFLYILWSFSTLKN